MYFFSGGFLLTLNLTTPKRLGLLAKVWPLGSRLWRFAASLLLFHWYSVSGVVLVLIPDLCTLTY